LSPDFCDVQVYCLGRHKNRGPGVTDAIDLQLARRGLNEQTL